MKALRVIVIDDDLATRKTIEAQLYTDGYDLQILTGGVEALELLETEPADLVICDLMMPEVDGFAVTRAFKAHSEWRFVPIIVLTAMHSAEVTIAGLEAGADELVTKPIEGAVLRARARSMLRVRQTYRRLRGDASRREEVIQAARLTDREREVLDLLLLGRTHEDIAVVLGITARTARFHQSNLLDKLGAESRMDLIRLFLERD